MSRAGRIEGRRTSKRRSRGNESEREEQKLPQTKTKQKDDRKCAACLAPNTGDRLEAVIERETQQRLNCLISPKRCQPKCEVPPPPFRPPPTKHYHSHSAQLQPGLTDTHTYTHSLKVLRLSLQCKAILWR